LIITVIERELPTFSLHYVVEYETLQSTLVNIGSNSPSFRLLQ